MPHVLLFRRNDALVKHHSVLWGTRKIGLPCMASFARQVSPRAHRACQLVRLIVSILSLHYGVERSLYPASNAQS